jgi:tetratricopeptide (TPR) repeat protein
MMPDQLSPETSARLDRLCEEGSAALKRGRYWEGIDRFQVAWELLPEPKEIWEAATWILAAIGDVYYLNSHFDKALEFFGKAVRCPGGLGNPFIHLRLGESAYELGNMTRADDELTRAYMGAGKDNFVAEDPKYLKRLSGILLPSPGSDSLKDSP